MILHRYFARRFLASFLGVFAVIFAMLVLIDLVEQARRFSAQASGFGELATLTLLNVPRQLYLILPLIMILSTLGLFLSLARSSELVVTRGAGRSALNALIAPVLVAFLIGAAAVAVLNPIVAATSAEYDARIGDLRGQPSTLALADGAVWLRQGGDHGQSVIRATRSNLDGTELSEVSFLTFAPDGRPLRRIEADSATLEPGGWRLSAAKVWPLADSSNPEADALDFPEIEVTTTLTPEQIRDSFGAPAAIPIWDLPRFIASLQEAGFAARRHQMFLQAELALPLFLVAMVLIGAAFTMRHQRGRRTGIMVLSAVLLSFAVYFLRNFAQILGENGELPVALAAWAPPVVAICLALGLLLHLEDG